MSHTPYIPPTLQPGSIPSHHQPPSASSSPSSSSSPHHPPLPHTNHLSPHGHQSMRPPHHLPPPPPPPIPASHPSQPSHPFPPLSHVHSPSSAYPHHHPSPSHLSHPPQPLVPPALHDAYFSASPQPPVPLAPSSPPPLPSPASLLPDPLPSLNPPHPPLPPSSTSPTTPRPSSSPYDPLSNPTSYHALKKGRRKRGPKWTVEQTFELLDALNAYVLERGYPSSSEHGKSDEWATICRDARQDGRFTGYQACNRVSNLRKDLNAYLVTTHLRFLSDAPDLARALVATHYPQTTDSKRQERQQEVLTSIRESTRMVEDWCSTLELDGDCAFFEDVQKHLQTAKTRNADLWGYHPRFKKISESMRTVPSNGGDRKRGRNKRKADAMGGGGVGGVGREAGVGGMMDAQQGEGLSLGDELDGPELPPMEQEGEGDGDDDGHKVEEDGDAVLLEPAHIRMQGGGKKGRGGGSALGAVSSSGASMGGEGGGVSGKHGVAQRGGGVGEKKKKVTASELLLQVQAALSELEGWRRCRKEKLEEAFASKDDWYDKICLTAEERRAVDPYVRNVLGLFGITEPILQQTLDAVSVGTWKKVLDRYE